MIDGAHGFLDLDWGNVPSWVGTLGVFLAILTYRQGAKTKRREQAGLVTVWSSQPIAPPSDGIDLVKYRDVKVSVKNASPIAVHGLRVRTHASTKRADAGVMRWVGEDQKWRIGDLGPGESEEYTYTSVIFVRVDGFSFADSTGRDWENIGGKLHDVTARERRLKLQGRVVPTAIRHWRTRR